jgi:hypothetical protein
VHAAATYEGVTRRAISTLALLALAAGLTGCGGGGVSSPVASAATKSKHAGGVKVKLSISFMVGGLPSGVVSGDGMFDQSAGEMTIDMSNLLQNLNLPIGSGGGIKEIYLQEKGDPVLYMDIPFLAGQLPQGKTWVRLDLQQAGNALGLDFNKLLGQSGSNPAQTLDMLRASGKVEKVGPDIVGGVNVTQYHASVDLKKALELKGISESTVQNLIDAGAPTQFPVDVWIGNGDGLVHQMRMSQSGTANGRSVSTLTTMTLSDWGTQVSEQAPPADQVFDATALASKSKKA